MPQSTPDEEDWPVDHRDLVEAYSNKRISTNDFREKFFRNEFPPQTRIPIVIYIDEDGKLTDASDTRPGIRREVIGEAFINDGEINANLGPEIGSKVLDSLYDVRKQRFSLGFGPPPDVIKKLSLLEWDGKDVGITNIEFLSNGEPEPNTPLAEEKALIREVFEENILDVLAKHINEADEATKHYNVFDLSETPPLSENPDLTLVQVPSCTCYWNNNYMRPGILPPHHVDCPSLHGRHYVDDDCGEEGHRDDERPKTP